MKKWQKIVLAVFLGLLAIAAGYLWWAIERSCCTGAGM